MTQAAGSSATRCGGCERTSDQAKLFPARDAKSESAGLFICEHCIRECAQAIADAPTRIPGSARACSFCAKPEDYVAIIIAIGPKLICDECVDHYRGPAA